MFLPIGLGRPFRDTAGADVSGLLCRQQLAVCATPSTPTASIISSKANVEMHPISRFLLATLGCASIIAGFNFTIDPQQIFHSAWLTQARYSSNPRIGDAGLIRSQDFDTVFMGTSYSLHFRQGEI